jgi:NADPH-dependent curcumin reductase CurA
MPVPADFAVVDVNVPPTGEGQVKVQTLIMSVDPYMRPRLNVDQALDAPLLGGGIGRVVESRNPKFAEGQLVRQGVGFREVHVTDGKALSRLDRDPALPLSVYMHALGGTGITAYGGLLEVGALKDGEQVVVSTAGGAVGSVVAQIAKIKGCHVVGLTGTDEKAAVAARCGRAGCGDQLQDAAAGRGAEAATPKGIDVYFENVGGAHLDAALPRMNVHGRIPVCGMISTYNGGGEGVNGPVQHDLQAHPHGGVRRDRLRAHQCAVRVGHDRVAEERTDQVSGDDARWLRARAGRPDRAVRGQAIAGRC